MINVRYCGYGIYSVNLVIEYTGIYTEAVSLLNGHSLKKCSTKVVSDEKTWLNICLVHKMVTK